MFKKIYPMKQWWCIGTGCSGGGGVTVSGGAQEKGKYGTEGQWAQWEWADDWTGGSQWCSPTLNGSMILQTPLEKQHTPYR